MANIVVCGAGQIGTAVAFYLWQMGHLVTVLDSSEENINKSKKSLIYKYDKIGNLPNYIKVDICSSWIEKKDSVVISCLPYHENVKVAKHCIDLGISYLDLGGSIQVSQEINAYALEKGSQVCTDVGLAPGLINIEVWNGMSQFKNIPQSVLMAVGGIPNIYEVEMLDKGGILKYGITWSIDGLVNEMTDQCLILENGRKQTVTAMSSCVDYNERRDGQIYEMFRTSGGLSHSLHEMMEYGVRNCEYKTIRYKGHCKILKGLLEGLSKTQVKEVLRELCPPVEDVVHLYLNIHYDFDYQEEKKTINKEGLTYKSWKTIFIEDGFTAMQRATAIPASIITHMVASKRFNKTNVSYRDIAQDSLFHEMKKEMKLYE